MSEPALSVSNLVKSFRGRRVVDDVSMEVTRGEIVGFLGPNGAGKTTVMNMIMGLVPPDEGRIEVLGANGAARRQTNLRIGYLQEKPRLYPDMTAADYLAHFARLYGVPRPRQRVGAVLERVGLTEAARRRVGTFSRGMQQRVCLARVMLHEPELLILDEPTLGLDPEGVAEMREIFRAMRAGGATLIFSSHQLAELERIADSVLFLSRGRLIAAGRPKDLLPIDGAGDVVTVELYEAAAPLIERVRHLPCVADARITGPHHVEIALAPTMTGSGRTRHAYLVHELTAAAMTPLSVTAALETLESWFLRLAKQGPAHTERN